MSQEYHAAKEAESSVLGKLFLASGTRKFLSWMMTISAHLWPKSMFMEYLRVESLYDNKTIEALAGKIMGDPQEVAKFKNFADMMAPLDLRACGMDQEMLCAAGLPRYPLERIRVPVLVTQSRVDRDVVMAHGEFVEKTVKGAESYYFDGCGHLFWFGHEWPRIKSKLIDFLKRNCV